MSFNQSNYCYTLIVLISTLHSLTVVSANNQEVQACLSVLESNLCGAENLTPQQCVRNAFLKYFHPLNPDYVQDYYAMLFEFLDHDSVLIPKTFCRTIVQEMKNKNEAGDSSSSQPPVTNVASSSQLPVIIDFNQCMNALRRYWTPHAVVNEGRYAFGVAYLRIVAEEDTNSENERIIVTQYLAAMKNTLKYPEICDMPDVLTYCRHLFDPEHYTVPRIEKIITFIKRATSAT